MGPELDLRPQLESLDRLMLRSAGLDPGAPTLAFRPLWQLDAASAAAIALQKARGDADLRGAKACRGDDTPAPSRPPIPIPAR